MNVCRQCFRWFAGWLVLCNLSWAAEPKTESQFVTFLGENGILVLELRVQAGGLAPQQLFQQFVDDQWKRMDANGDGTVTVEESQGKYLTVRDAAQAQLIPQPAGNAVAVALDASPKDGKITRAEFLNYYKRTGLHPFVIQFLASSTISRQARQSGGSAEVQLFTQIDLNNDGRLSASELTGTLQTLRKLDLDNDETISAAELNPINNQAALASQQMNSPAASTSPFLGAGFDESLPKQIKRLIEKYDTTDPAKSGTPGVKTKNQKLSPQELGIDSSAIEPFDGDGNGQLDFDELRQFVTTPPPSIVVTVNLDASEPVVAEAARPELQEKLRVTADGAANVNLGTTQLSLVRGANPSIDAENLFKPQFMAADADANGYLEKSEAERAFLFGASFEDLDADKNGKVFLDEAVAYFQVRFDAARSRIVLTINEQGRTLFEILDLDRDRRLSYRELQAAANKFSLWDKDGDGLLSQSEIPQQYRLVVARGNLPILGATFGDPQAVQTGNLPERAAGPIWYRKMDKNRDGEISQREFLGEPQTFEMLDRNHDGFIDLTEALQVGESP